MGVTNVIVVCLIAALVAFVVALAVKQNKGETPQVIPYVGGRMDSIQRYMDTALERLEKIENTVKFLRNVSVNSTEAEKETGKKPITVESVRTALRYNGFSPEIIDTHLNEWQVVRFKVEDTQFRVDASRAPFLTLELGYALNPEEEDLGLMMRAAQEVTSGIFIGKAAVLGEGKAVVFQAEMYCDSYVYLRDNFKTFLDIVIETHKRFFDSYNRLKEEKQKATDELYGRSLPSEGDSNGAKILS